MSVHTGGWHSGTQAECDLGSVCAPYLDGLIQVVSHSCCIWPADVTLGSHTRQCAGCSHHSASSSCLGPPELPRDTGPSLGPAY